MGCHCLLPDLYLPDCKAIALNSGPHGLLLIVAKWMGTKLAAQTAVSLHGRKGVWNSGPLLLGLLARSKCGIPAQPPLATRHHAILGYWAALL